MRTRILLALVVVAAGAATVGHATADDAAGLDLPVNPATATFTDAPVAPPPPAAPPPLAPTAPPPPPPPTVYGRDLRSASGSVIFVLDVSGSMGWDVGQYVGLDGHVAQGCRLDRAKVELTRSLRSLPVAWRFDVLAYDCTLRQWAPDLTDASADHVAAAAAWVADLEPGGATATGPAGAAALAIPANRLVVLLTDGNPNCGAGSGWGSFADVQAHREMIRAANGQRATVDVFGIGATGCFKQFCQDVAADNGGGYTDVR